MFLFRITVYSVQLWNSSQAAARAAVEVVTGGSCHEKTIKQRSDTLLQLEVWWRESRSIWAFFPFIVNEAGVCLTRWQHKKRKGTLNCLSHVLCLRVHTKVTIPASFSPESIGKVTWNFTLSLSVSFSFLSSTYYHWSTYSVLCLCFGNTDPTSECFVFISSLGKMSTNPGEGNSICLPLNKSWTEFHGTTNLGIPPTSLISKAHKWSECF